MKEETKRNFYDPPKATIFQADTEDVLTTSDLSNILDQSGTLDIQDQVNW